MSVESVSQDQAASQPAKAETRFEVVHAGALQFFPELVRELGGDPDELLRQARIDPSALSKRGSVLEYRSMINLMELSAAQLRRPDFGLRFAKLQGGTRVMGPIGVVMKNSETLGQALGYCARRIYAYCLATRVRFRPDRANHKLFLGLEILLDRAPFASQVMEHALCLANLNVMDMTGGAVHVREVAFRHQPISSPAVYRAAFGCEVRFGQPADGIVFTEQDLLCPVVGSDEQIYEMATSFIDSRYPENTPPLYARVRALIVQYLGASDCSHEHIAGELCLHPRTLQRRLKSEGKSFEGIRDEVRREVALRCLNNPDIPLTRVAEKLGYAEQSVLARSCFRWFAASPRELRRKALADGLVALETSSG
jgi:AraC-like DNA-binding protein